MKQIFFTLLLIAGFAGSVQARTITAVSNGDWASTSTWNPAIVPNANDTVVIPKTKTVNITQNENMNQEYLLLRVMGTLKFVGNGSKLKVNDQSVILVYPDALIDASSNSQSITIGNTDVLNGQDIAGGATGYRATGTSNGFQPFNFNTLPVRFVAYTATRQAGNVLLQWTTSMEAGAFSFEIESSTDGRTWTKQGEVKAAGTTNYEQNYSFTARNLAGGELQFRIKQIDLDGKYMYTAARRVAAAGQPGDIRLTAAAGRVLVQFGQEIKGATVRIMSLTGQVLQEQKLASAFGQVLIPTSQKGLCLVTVVTETEISAAQKVLL